MILYTPLPLQLVLAGDGEFKPSYEEVNIRGCKVLVERMSSTQATVVRVLSTDPAHFLDPSLSPGAVITFRAM